MAGLVAIADQQCEHELSRKAPSLSGMPSLVAIGNFDGVHRGHQAMLQHAVEQARSHNLQPTVLTFHPHPTVVLGKSALRQLTTLPRKLFLLSQLAPAVTTHVQPFTTTFAEQTPEAFVTRLLCEQLTARVIVVGQNFRFGHRRAAGLPELRDLGHRLGFRVEGTQMVGDETGPWSSSRVRSALQQGSVGEATSILGRPHSIEGVVVHGFQRGRSLGFPTANLEQIEEACPAWGVYAVVVDRVHEPGGVGQRLAYGVANLGARPTFAAGFAVEVHLLAWSGDLYGARLRVHLIEQLRTEQTFTSIEHLRTQIERDVVAAHTCLSSLKNITDLST